MKWYFKLWQLSMLIVWGVTDGDGARIWLLRHCDKPKRTEFRPNCCNDLGYQRIQGWKTFFHNQPIDVNHTRIYASGFNDKKQDYQCLSNAVVSGNRNCQRSQRMFITASMIASSYNVMVNTTYCIGDVKQLYQQVIHQGGTGTGIHDTIIVWEHTEIIEFIRYLNFPIGDWTIDDYSLVFLIQSSNPTNSTTPSFSLSYDCYDFVTNQSKCSKNIQSWLHRYPTISSSLLKSSFEKDVFLLYSILFLVWFISIGWIIYLRRCRRSTYVMLV